MSAVLKRCPWGCGQDRLRDEYHLADAVKCAQCGADIPSPQVQMFARLKGETVEQFLSRRGK